MTMKLRLDTDGLRALIKDNPELEVEIGQAVLKNIKTDQIQLSVNAQIEACLKGMVKNEGSSWAPRYVPVDKQFTEIVRKTVVEAITHFATEQLKDHVEQLAMSAVRSERDKLGSDLRALLRSLVTPEMAKEIIREKIL